MPQIGWCGWRNARLAKMRSWPVAGTFCLATRSTGGPSRRNRRSERVSPCLVAFCAAICWPDRDLPNFCAECAWVWPIEGVTYQFDMYRLDISTGVALISLEVTRPEWGKEVQGG